MQKFDSPITTSDQSIDRVLATGLPIALVFLDGRVPPGLEQAMGRLARENAGQLLVAKVDVEDSPATARRFAIATPPAVVTLRGGQTLAKAEAVSEVAFERHVAFLLGKGPRPEPARPQAAPGHAARPQAGRTADARPRPVTDATFDQEVLRSPHPVLVDFWAPWCAPCRMIEPIVERMAGEYAGRMRVAKVNVDENPIVAGRFGVQSIPSMMVVKDGQVVDRWAGALPEPMLRDRVARWIGVPEHSPEG